MYLLTDFPLVLAIFFSFSISSGVPLMVVLVKIFFFPLGSMVFLPPPAFLFRSDRKSTRLNSSHQIISYAVFCLKKKTIGQLCKRGWVVCEVYVLAGVWLAMR